MVRALVTRAGGGVSKSEAPHKISGRAAHTYNPRLVLSGDRRIAGVCWPPAQLQIFRERPSPRDKVESDRVGHTILLWPPYAHTTPHYTHSHIRARERERNKRRLKR